MRILVLALLLSHVLWAKPTSPIGEEQALLQAIWEFPDEDTPRLVYADWLDEHGDVDRAEFIRLQCEREWVKSRRAREEALLTKNRQKWVPRWLLEHNQEIAEVRFSRGFLELVRVVRPELILSEPDRFFSELPFLRALDLDGSDPSSEYNAENLVALLVRRPEMQRVVAFRHDPPAPYVDAFLSGREFRLIATQLRSLRELDYYGFVDTTDLEVLMTSPQAKQLEYLSLRSGAGPSHLPPETYRVTTTLLRSKAFPALVELRLDVPSPFVFSRLDGIGDFPQLKVLSVGGLGMPGSANQERVLARFLRGNLAAQLKYVAYGSGREMAFLLGPKDHPRADRLDVIGLRRELDPWQWPGATELKTMLREGDAYQSCGALLQNLSTLKGQLPGFFGIAHSI